MNIGIVGCGNISETYFECQKIFNNFKIVACADINNEAASNAASKYNVKALSVDEILENNQIERAKRMGVQDIKKKYELKDMIIGDVIFCASAITKGDMLDGVKVVDKEYSVSSLVMHKDKKIIKKTKNTYNM